jgi:dephospho-CoA kinase
MRLVGLTGGIASGKSTFAARLRELGAVVLDADVLAREAVARGSPGLVEVVEAFGAGVLAPDGSLDRKRVGERVFRDPAARARLEEIIHPRVRAAMREAVARLAADGAPFVFYDVPLLYEAGVDREVDLVVVVWAPRDVQLARLAARDGLAGAAAEARLTAQLPLDEKAARADAVVANDGPPEALAAKAAAVLTALTAGLPRRSGGAPPRRF